MDEHKTPTEAKSGKHDAFEKKNMQKPRSSNAKQV